MKKKVITILTILLVIAAAVLVFVSSELSRRVTPNPTGTVGNTAGNLYNGGVFCEDDGYVYFSNPYDNDALYRMRPDESEMKRLITTGTQYINSAGKYFYYFQKNSGSGEGLGFVVDTTGIYRVQKNNTAKSKCIDRVTSTGLLLADNTLYYTVADRELGTYLKKTDIDDTNSELYLKQVVVPTVVQNGKLYFCDGIDNNHLMSVNIGSTSKTDVLAEDVYMPIIEGNDLYCIDIHNDYQLVHFNLVTGEKTVLDETRTDLLNVTDSYIYYQTSGDTPQLKRIAKDGSRMEVVADGAYNTISATSQYVYFIKFGTTTPMYKTPVNGSVSISTFDAAQQAAMKDKKKK